MDERHTLSALTMQFALACNLCTLVYLFTLTNAGTGRYYPLVLLAYAPAIYGLDRLFLRRSRTMRGLVIFNGVTGGGVFLSICLVDGWSSWVTLLFTAIFCLWPALQAGKLALEPPKLHSMILCLDASAVLLVLFVAFLSAIDLPVYWSVPAAAGCTAAVLGVVSRRINRSMGLRDWGMVLLAFGVIFAGMLLVVGFAAAPAGKGIVALWHGLVALSQLLIKALMWLMLLLASLFEPTEGGELPPVQSVQLPTEEEMMGETNPLAAMIFIGLCLVIALCLAAYLFYRLGKLRIGGKRGGAVIANKERRRRLSFRKAIGRLLAAIGARLRLCAFLWRERNTPRGLFCILVRRCRMGPWHKRPGETPREFLIRLRESARGDQELIDALDELIPAVDRALYAMDSDNCHVPAARLIRRRIGTAVYRQFLRDCWGKVRALRRDSAVGKAV